MSVEATSSLAGQMALPRQAGRPWRRAAGWLAFLGPFFYLTYGIANYLAGLRGAVPAIVFDWERQLPFWAWTIFPYWSINVFYGLSLFLCATRHEVDRHVLRLLTAQVAAVTFFIATPLAFTFGQPAADGPAGWLFAALRGFDKPFNQAPSLHIALAVILWDLYRRLIAPRWARAVLHAWTFLICASVLTTYQHHFIDIPTGALLGLVCVWLWPLDRRVPPWMAWQPTRNSQRRRLAAWYGTGAAACFAMAIVLGGAALWLMWPAVALLLVALNYLGLGERGFAKHRDGGTVWTVRFILAPYRFGAWLNSRWWTRGQPREVQVVRGLWLGRLPGRAASPPWASAVNVAAELDSPCAVPTLHLPAIDLVVPPAAWLLRAAFAIERQRVRHGSVLVFCALGYSRSAAAVAAWLLVTRRAATVEEAMQVVRNARPGVVLSRQHAQAIAAASRMASRA